MIDSPFWRILRTEIQRRGCTYEIVRVGNDGVYVKVIKDRL